MAQKEWAQLEEALKAKGKDFELAPVATDDRAAEEARAEKESLRKKVKRARANLVEEAAEVERMRGEERLAAVGDGNSAVSASGMDKKSKSSAGATKASKEAEQLIADTPDRLRWALETVETLTEGNNTFEKQMEKLAHFQEHFEKATDNNK